MKNVLFKKSVYLGTQPEYGRRGEIDAKVFCTIEIREDGELSITGVIGPYSNGDCAGSCGQIYDSITVNKPAPGWTKCKIKKFIEVWKRWHLNNMRPNCIHQTPENGFDPSREVEIYKYMLKTEYFTKQREIKNEAIEWLEKEGKATISSEAQAVLNLPLSFTSHVKNDRAEYDLKKTETKTLGWLSEKEHPEGCLSRACPTCGYKYGSAWIREPLPQEITDYIAALPEATETNPWKS